MLSLRLNQAYSVAKFLENLEICIFAESLGGTETFITFLIHKHTLICQMRKKTNVELMNISSDCP